MNKIRFESLGVYLPETIVTTKELIGRMKNPPSFDLEGLTGISNRRWRSENEDSFKLAAQAAKKCLNKSNYKPDDLDAIIFCSITRFKDGMTYWLEPGMSIMLKHELGMRESAVGFDITNACAGMWTGIYLLYSMIKSGAVRNGMVLSGECITTISETAVKEIKDPIDDQFASLTVGDSGAAVILDEASGCGEGINSIEMLAIAKYADLCFGMPSVENPGWAMYTEAIDIHKQVTNNLPQLLGHMRTKYKVDVGDFDFIIPHQTSLNAQMGVLKKCTEFLGSEEIPEVLFSLHDFGNTSSTSHFVVLYDYIKKGRIKNGARILFIPLASGIVFGFGDVILGDLEVE